MSKCTPKSKQFIDEIANCLYGYNYNHGFYRCKIMNDIKVYYDGGKYNKRDYVLKCGVNNWNSDDTYCLKYELRKVGATNIIGGVKHAIARDYIELAFDIKISKLKELGIDN